VQFTLNIESSGTQFFMYNSFFFLKKSVCHTLLKVFQLSAHREFYSLVCLSNPVGMKNKLKNKKAYTMVDVDVS